METMKTIDIEPTWVNLLHLVTVGDLNAKEIEPACKIADIVRQAQKRGLKSVSFVFDDDGVKIVEET